MIKRIITSILIILNLVIIIQYITIITPVRVVTTEDEFTNKLIMIFNIEDDLARIMTKASLDYDFNPIFIATLMMTESNFNPNAKSSVGYVGLMQTPNKSGYNDVDIRHGLSILREKMIIAKGDVFQALVYYKGGVSEEGKLIASKQANHVLKLYEKNLKI